nr:beta-galactosidase [uncultured Sellimonas sp.]
MRVININGKAEKRKRLPFGYEDPSCPERTLGATDRYLTRNGSPWFPVMGEFHFSRFRREFWEEEIEKMKAGEVQILATYVFWIHHEEKEDQWNFEGQRDLRRFLEVCEKCRMPVLLRIGPWSHGECRNGGFPDWLIQKAGIEVRTDQPLYLSYVRRFFEKIYEQTDGFLWKQGGPVLGIQVENEYGHCGGLTGEAGIRHMKTIKHLAEEAGFRVPYYTATGWGGAIVPEGEMLPVLGGYCDAPWEQHLHEMPLNANYLFSHSKDDGNIGTDLQKEREQEFTYDVEAYPYLTAELGGGVQPTMHRRPIADKRDTCAMALCKLGSGANLLGYYMYHGGTNPKGEYSTLQESKETGYLNDLPVYSYDFQAPIGEYGRIHEVFYHLRPYHLMLKEFGSRMAETTFVLPDWSARRPEDLTGIRAAVRHDATTGSGFLFWNHYQRHAVLEEHLQEEIVVKTKKREIPFPKMDLKNGMYGCFPYQFSWGELLVESANAQLLCGLKDRLVFFADDPETVEYRVRGDRSKIITLSREQAEHAWKIHDRLFLADGCICQDGEGYDLITFCPEGRIRCIPEGEIGYQCEEKHARVVIRNVVTDPEYTDYELTIQYPDMAFPENYWLGIDFDGDRAEIRINGEMIGDWFYTGMEWQIGLKYFDWPKQMTVRIYPVREAVYLEKKPEKSCEIRKMDIQTEYRVGLGKLN